MMRRSLSKRMTMAMMISTIYSTLTMTVMGDTMIPSDAPSLAPSVKVLPPPLEPNPACEEDATADAVNTGLYCNNNCAPKEFVELACGPPTVGNLQFCLCIITDLVPLFENCPVIDGVAVEDLGMTDLVEAVTQPVIEFCCSFAKKQCQEFGILPPDTDVPSDMPSLVPSDMPSDMPSYMPSSTPTDGAPKQFPPPEDPNPACEDDAAEDAVDTGLYCNNNCGPKEFVTLACGPPMVGNLQFCLCIITDLIPIFEDCPVIDGVPVEELGLSDLVDAVTEPVIEFCCSFAKKQCQDFGILPPDTEVPSDVPSLIPSDMPSGLPSMTPTDPIEQLPPPEEPNPACEDGAMEDAVDTELYCNNNCSPHEFVHLACGPPKGGDLKFCFCMIVDVMPLMNNCPVMDGEPVDEVGKVDSLVTIIGQDIINVCCVYGRKQCQDFGLIPP